MHFDRHAGDDQEEDTLQDPDFQRVWLRRILGSLKGRLNEISLRHYENTGDRAAVPRSETPALMNALSHVISLRMSVKHRETNGDAGPIYRVSSTDPLYSDTYSQLQCANIHPFWDRFTDRFLRPAHETLSTVALYSDVPFGWFPKLDFRSIHLERLRSLTLGHYIFCHDHQVSWILDHHQTLQELNLDRCSILYQVGHSIGTWLDAEGYPIGKDPHNTGYPDFGWSSDPPDHGQQDTVHFRSWSLRWYQIFADFADRLHNLGIFRFGVSGQWDFNTESRYAERGGGSYQLPVMPWRDEKNVVSSTFDEQYVIWDDWEQQYRARWRKGKGPYAPHDRVWKAEITERFEAYPDCQKEDAAALQELLESIDRRV